jgi:nicotinamide riboside kinase
MFTLALVGSSGVGKTTLAHALHTRLPGAVVIAPEAARGFFTEHPHLWDERFTLATQRQVQDRQARNEANALECAHRSGAAVVVCDRSVHDAAAYLRVRDREGSDRLHARVRCAYDVLVVCDPAGIPYETDDIRREGTTDRDRFHAAYLDYLTHHRLPYTLLAGTEAERLDQLVGLIARKEPDA